MRVLLLSFFLYCFSYEVNAQQWAPPGATWHYGIGHAFSAYDGYKKWAEKGQAIKNGKNCVVIESDGRRVWEDNWETYYTYEDSGRVYWFNDSTQDFSVLYDFNKVVGESWVINMDTCQFTMSVDSIKTVMINGTSRRAILIDALDSYFSGWAIEGIGSLYRPYPDISFGCFNVINDDLYYRSIRCYSDDSIGIHQFDTSVDCEYTDIEKYENGNSISIYPNPVSNVLYIESELSNYTLMIYNSLGQLMLEKNLLGNLALDVQYFQPGMYFTAFKADKGFYSGPRFIKK